MMHELLLIMTLTGGFWFFGKDKPVKTPEYIEVTDSTYLSEVIETKDTIVYVLFWASWCSWCKKLDPVIEELSHEESLFGKIKFTKLNAESNPKTAQLLRIKQIPDSRIFQNGKQIGRLLGYMEKDTLLSNLNKLLEQLASPDTTSVQKL
jgi:thioredoxin 1